MYEEKKQNLESICQGLLSLGFSRAKAFMNLLMVSCSYLEAKNVVALTASHHYHYHYSNISKVSDNLCKDKEEYGKVSETLLCYFVSTCPVLVSKTGSGVMYYSFSQDMCMAYKSASACLPDKVYGHQANSLGAGIVEGYKLDFTHLHASKDWVLPIAIEIVAPEGNATDLAVKQLNALIADDSLPFGKTLCINNVDSGYGNARYLSPLHAHKNLINIARLRGSMKVYPVFSGEQKAKSNPKIYGKTYYLTNQTLSKKGYYLFSKQNLFLGKFQTPDKVHFLSHLLVILASWWLMYAAKDEVELKVPVWQQYSAKNKEILFAQETNEKAELTPSQVRKGMENLFDTFDKTPYLPTKYKKR
jgi:hypothetical protein